LPYPATRAKPIAIADRIVAIAAAAQLVGHDADILIRVSVKARAEFLCFAHQGGCHEQRAPGSDKDAACAKVGIDKISGGLN